jgi:ketosteroid isomerase-like protein
MLSQTREMNKLITFGFLFVLVAVFSVYGQDVPQNISRDATEFLQIEQKIEDAVVRSDLDYLKNVYAEDFRFAHGSGNVQGKKQWLESVAKGLFVSRTVSANEIEFHDDIAISAARLDVTRRGKNGEEKYWLKYTRVYRRNNNQWKMISHRTIQETHLQ